MSNFLFHDRLSKLAFFGSILPVFVYAFILVNNGIAIVPSIEATADNPVNAIFLLMQILVVSFGVALLRNHNKESTVTKLIRRVLSSGSENGRFEDLPDEARSRVAFTGMTYGLGLIQTSFLFGLVFSLQNEDTTLFASGLAFGLLGYVVGYPFRKPVHYGPQ